MKNTKLVLFGSLALGIGSWMLGFQDWNDLLTVQAVGGLLGILGGIVLAWFGQSPLKPNGTTKPIVNGPNGY